VKKHEPRIATKTGAACEHHKRMKMIVLVVASLIVFLVAAKVHGRSIRLEREAMGVMSVTFGGPPGTNPPEVEALWRADRWRFWPLTGRGDCICDDTQRGHHDARGAAVGADGVVLRVCRVERDAQHVNLTSWGVA
jgi:hypothetical protein